MVLSVGEQNAGQGAWLPWLMPTRPQRPERPPWTPRWDPRFCSGNALTRRLESLLLLLLLLLLLSRFRRVQLCHPIDGSPPGSSVYGILQVRVLEWVAISFSNLRVRRHERGTEHARLQA